MQNQTDAYLIEGLQVKLLNTALNTVGIEWNYSNLVSPFTRIFYVESGNGYILPDNNMHELKPGYIYLIPSYTLCSYHCTEQLSLHYIHLTTESSEGLKIFDFLSFSNEAKATPLDTHLFQRLLEINQQAALKNNNPEIYEKESWTTSSLQSVNGQVYLESTGILQQILSRFITESKIESHHLEHVSGLRKTFKFINSHLSEDIKIDDLAALACYSNDHFSRLFKKTTGILPLQYINQKRIEKAQVLLLTSSKSQEEISEHIGFNSLNYYYKIFKRMVGCTPLKYRQMGGLV